MEFEFVYRIPAGDLYRARDEEGYIVYTLTKRDTKPQPYHEAFCFGPLSAVAKEWLS